jgi:hypothetical protein
MSFTRLSRDERHHGTILVMASEPPAQTSLDALDTAPCPRCGGQGVPPRREVTAANPFLRRTRSGALVCVDCGLDFQAPDAPPPSGDWPW